MSITTRTYTFTICDVCGKDDRDVTFEEYGDYGYETGFHICDTCHQEGWVEWSSFDANYNKPEKDQVKLPDTFFVRYDEETEEFDYSRIVPVN